MAPKTKKRAAAKKPTPRKAPEPTPAAAEPIAATPADTVLVLRTAKPDGSSRNGFVWPKAGPVECPDWAPTVQCGQGLHGWLWGAGNITSSSDYATEGAWWLVVEVAKADVIDLNGKVKFPRGVVVFCGEAKDAAAFIAARAPIGTPIIHGTATAGDSGTATAGYRGTATAGDSGTATAGLGGTIAIRYYDAKLDRYRTAIAEVGIDGIEPATAYILDTSGERARFVKKLEA